MQITKITETNRVTMLILVGAITVCFVNSLYNYNPQTVFACVVALAIISGVKNETKIEKFDTNEECDDETTGDD